MDFSTPDRTLLSLRRRRPALSDEVLELADRLLEIRKKRRNRGAGGRDVDVVEEYGDGILGLLEEGCSEGDGGGEGWSEKEGRGQRWEPIAAGIYLSADFLASQTRALSSSVSAGAASSSSAAATEGGDKAGGGEYYAEGPRVPATTATATSASAVPAAAEEMLHHDEVVDSSPSSSRPSASGDGSGSGGELAIAAPASPSYMVKFCSTLLAACQSNLEHDEPRVRTLVSKVVGAHARYGLALSSSSSLSAAEGGASKDVAAENELSAQRRNLHANIVSGLRRQMDLGRDTAGKKSKSSTGALDDTTGWRALETHLHGLAAFVDGCGGSYVVAEEGEGGGGGVRDEELLKALEGCCVEHVNRHVRAAGIAVLDRMVSAVNVSGASNSDLLTDPDSKLRNVVVAVLKETLADNWSQVRMAASVLCRTFLLALLQTETEGADGGSGDEEEDVLDGLYPTLLPRMCLNRFYLAQGVKLYSHDTWRMVFPPPSSSDAQAGGVEEGTPGKRSGLDAVARTAGAVCRYYCKMCDADNHVVREAACQAVAELASKIGTHPVYSEYLSPYVPAMLQSLLLCFHDESWPVRDEACLACGIFCKAYPEECGPELDTLFGRWTEQLTDQIWSVREDAGVALGDAVVAYGPEMYERVLTVLRDAIPSAKSQPAMTREEFKKRQNDIEAHTNTQLYSCGSLAPKLKKGSAVDAAAMAEAAGGEGKGPPGKGRIGCMSCLVDRPKSPWERTDGCIYLLRELCDKCTGPSGEAYVKCGIELADDVLLPLMAELVDACRLKHYPQSDDLRATLWRQLPSIARSVGKVRFKRHYLQMFLDTLMSNLDDRYGGGASPLSVHAAGQCAEELADIVGKGIFRGRLEEDWQQEAFDRVMRERAMTAGMGPAHVGMEPDGFSPFGPPSGGGVPGAGLSSVGGGFPGAGTATATAFPPAGRMPQAVANGRAAHPSVSMPGAAVPGTGMMDAL